jgi:hypothetical protein
VHGDTERGEPLEHAMTELVVAQPGEEVTSARESRGLDGDHRAAAGRHGP